MPAIKGSTNLKLVFLGFSLLASILSVLIIRFDVFFVPAPRTSNNFIFGRIFNSLDVDPGGWSVSLKKEFGGRLQVSKPVLKGEVIMSLDSSNIIDGVQNVPTELSMGEHFSELSQSARILLCLVFSKLHADESDPLFLLWKGVGVHPIPDLRWVKHKGLFSATVVPPTGLDEVDMYWLDGTARVSESFQFAKLHNMHRQYGLTEPELKWAYIFLHAFGVSITPQLKVIVAPLVFARHTVSGADRAVEMRLGESTAEVVAGSDMEKGSEVLLDGSLYLSDVWTLFFQGSWVADDSLHRVSHIQGEEKWPKWFSNDPKEQSLWRVGRNLNEAKALVKYLKQTLDLILFKNNEYIDRLRFVKFHLVLTELVHAQKALQDLKLELVRPKF